MSPFQFYATPDLPDPDARRRFFSRLDAWSQDTGSNLTFACLEYFVEGRSEVVAHNPVLFLPADEQALEAGFSHNLRIGLRRNANKAARLGVKIDTSREEADLHAFYRGVLAPQYVRKHRMVFHPYGLYRGLLDLGMARLVVARWQGRVIGGLVLVEDVGGVRYAWGASESPEQVAVGTLMLRYALGEAIRRGLGWFDFGSTPLTADALYDFKMRWGGTSFPVRRYYTLRPPQEIDLNASFTFARRLYSFMPPAWARALMPRVVPWLVS